jgi:hypothetical protein
MDEMAVLPGLSFDGFRYCCTVVPGLFRFTFRGCGCLTRLQVGWQCAHRMTEYLVMTTKSKANTSHVTWVCWSLASNNNKPA